MDPNRAAGIRSHLNRAARLVCLAEGSAGSTSVDFAISAVYPARGAIELLREEARLGTLKLSPSALDREIDERVPYWDLIRALRVHDFHRSGLADHSGACLIAELKLPPLGTAEVSLGPLPDLTCAVAGDLVKHDFLLWAPPFAQVRSGEPPVHIVIALRQYLCGVEAIAQDHGVVDALTV